MKNFISILVITIGITTYAAPSVGYKAATNIAQNVIQINIDTNLLCTVSAAQAMTNGLATSFHGGVLSYLSFDSSQKVHTEWPITSAASVDGGTLIGLAYNDFSGFYANVNGAETSLPDYITSTSVTNGGAVAAAKAYADATTNALSTVAHTGKYDDLSNKPNITNIASVVATNVVRSANGGLWDASLQVWWTPVMSNGKLTYQATTNVNLNAGN